MTQIDDGRSGRLELFYKGKDINLAGAIFPWKILRNKQWTIDGISYEETLQELLERAKTSFNPQNPRIVSIGHGDGHESNIYTNALNFHEKEHKFAYLDLETAGINCPLNEGVIFLVHNSITMDYVLPKYYPEQLSGRNRALNAAFDGFELKKKPYTIK